VWSTVLVLAIAVNFEPTRVGLLPMLLARERPLLQLLAYLLGSLSMTVGFGLLVLFVLHRNPLGTDSANGGRAQVAVGVIAVVIAAAMAASFLLNHRRGQRNELTNKRRAANRLVSTTRAILGRGRSPWFSGFVGIGVGLPSVDYLALLVVIGASRVSPFEQAGALLTFVTVGNLVVLAPLVGFLVAPARTSATLERFGTWVRSRSKLEYAGFLALIGSLLIGLGWQNL
jgi:hypothetical protein